MLHSIKTKLKAIFNGLNNAKKTHNKSFSQDKEPNEEALIVEREQIPNTPFWLMKTETKWFIVLGMNRISPTFNTKYETNRWFVNHQWDVITQLILIITKTKNELNSEN